MKCAIIKQMRVVASALSLLGATQALSAEGCVLTLSEAQRLLSERNRDVLAARRAIESAQADRLSAAVTPPPVLSFNTSNINPKTGLGGGPLPDKRIDSVLRLDKTFERGGKLERRIEVAEEGITAARADADDSQRQQRLALAGAYYDLKLAQESLRIAQENVASYEESQRATELRLKAGDISAIEAQRLRVEQLRASTDILISACCRSP